MRRILAWALVVLAVGWGAAILAAPLVQGRPRDRVTPRLAAVTYLVGALVCHQRPERSFHLAGAQLPVCARCAALYWDSAIGLAGWLIARSRGGRSTSARRASAFAPTVLRRDKSPDRSRAAPAPQTAPLANRTLFARALVILAVPIVVTLATSAIGVWDPANGVRAISSAPFGVAVGALLAAVVVGDLR